MSVFILITFNPHTSKGLFSYKGHNVEDSRKIFFANGWETITLYVTKT